MYSSRHISSSRHIQIGGCALALLGLAATRPAAAQVIGNPSFETPVVGAGNFESAPTGGDWTFNAGISGNGSGFTSGNPNAPDGVQVAFLQGGNESFFQSIDGFSAGIYTVSFDAAQRATGGGGGVNGYASDFQNLQVLVDGTPLYDAAGLTPTSTNYLLYTSSPFTVGAGTHTLTFQGLNTAYSAAGRTGASVDDNTAFIDNVQLAYVGPAATTVPEASPALLLGLALLPLGWRAVRRRAA